MSSPNGSLVHLPHSVFTSSAPSAPRVTKNPSESSSLHLCTVMLSWGFRCQLRAPAREERMCERAHDLSQPTCPSTHLNRYQWVFAFQMNDQNRPRCPQQPHFISDINSLPRPGLSSLCRKWWLQSLLLPEEGTLSLDVF